MGSFSLCPVLGQKDQQEMKIPILRMSTAASISKMPAAFECFAFEQAMQAAFDWQFFKKVSACI